jgi:hemerythrin
MIRDALPDTRPNAQPLREILSHWFVNHAVKNDAHLKTLFQAMEKDCPDLLLRLS